MKQKFLQHIVNGETSFEMKHRDLWRGFYVIVNYGENKLIYLETLYGGMKHPELKSRLKLAGVIDKQGVVYMIEPPFGDFRFNDWDDQFVSFETAKKETEKKAQQYFLKEEETIPVNMSDISDFLINRAKSRAWALCLNDISGEELKEDKSFNIPYSSFYDIILGYETYQNLVDSYIKENMDQVIAHKIICQKALEYKSLYKERRELEIYRAIFPIDAVNFNVTFQKHGNTATGKMSKSSLLLKINNGNSPYDRDFGEYNFVNGKQGEKVLQTLRDPEKSAYDKENRIYIDDIVKITYGRKVLYEK